MDRDAAGEGEGKGGDQGDPPVAHDKAHQAREHEDACGRRQPSKQASGAHQRRHGGVERGGVGGGGHARQRPCVEQAETMQQLEPGLRGKDREIGRMVEELLRLAVVEQERVVDHHEIHVGIAPVEQRVAEQEERCGKAENDGGQPLAPAKEGEAVEAVLRRVGC